MIPAAQVLAEQKGPDKPLRDIRRRARVFYFRRLQSLVRGAPFATLVHQEC